MALSDAERIALRAQAEILRAEISQANVDTDEHVREASQALRDKALVAEVLRLDDVARQAVATQEAAASTSDDAHRAMIEAAQKLSVPSPDVKPAVEPAKPATETAPKKAEPASSATAKSEG